MIPSVSAVIVAGGKGERMQAAIRKQYLVLGERPILAHTLAVFDASPAIHRIYLVIPETDMEFCTREVVAPIHPRKPIRLVAGGLRRQDSVYQGLCAVSDPDHIVVIHDGVRPFVSEDQIATIVRVAQQDGACICAIPAVDTLKQVDEEGRIIRTVERQNIRMAQTPQAFQYSLIKQAHDRALADEVVGTDDSFLLERLGYPVRVIGGSPFNIKITTPEDLLLARAFVSVMARR